MRIFALAFLALSLCSCGRAERAQAGADAVAGIHAARAALEAGFATQEAINILTGVEKYIPAATSVNPAEWPAPRMTPEEIREDPKKYDESAPPVPSSWGLFAALGGAGVLALGLLRVAAPLIPGAGPLVKGVADLAWAALSTRDQKKVDQVHASVASAAATARPLLAALRNAPPESLPPVVAALLATPSVADALAKIETAAEQISR